MRHNEYIKKQQVNEGPIDFAKKVAAGVGGAMTAGQTWSGGYNREKYAQEINARAKSTMPTWHQQEAALEARGVTGPEVGKYLQAWVKQYFEIEPPPAIPAVDDASAFEYIKKAWAIKMTPQLQAAAQQQQQGGTTPVAPTTGNTAPTTGNVEAGGSTTTGNTAPTTGNTAPATSNVAPGAATVSSTDPMHAVFKDPNAFKAEWDKFVSSAENYKLIADPKLLDVLKRMWMRAGGMRAESKNNKGKRV